MENVMKFDPPVVCKQGRDIIARDGSKDDLVSLYTTSPVGSKEHDSIKAELTQELVRYRKSGEERCKVKNPDWSAERIAEFIDGIVPRFRRRKNGGSDDLDSLFDLDGIMDGIEADYVPSEPV
jgi:hypothetical protein